MSQMKKVSSNTLFWQKIILTLDIGSMFFY